MLRHGGNFSWAKLGTNSSLNHLTCITGDINCVFGAVTFLFSFSPFKMHSKLGFKGAIQFKIQFCFVSNF